MKNCQNARFIIDCQRMIDLWLSRAAVLELIGRNAEALQDLAKVREIAKRNSSKKIEADCLLQSSITLSTISKLEQIRDSANEALLLYREIQDKKGQEECLSYIGFAYFKFGDYAKAHEYLARALAMAEEIDDPRGAATSLIAMGLVFYDLGDYPRALDCTNRSLQLRETIGARRDAAACHCNISHIYTNLGDYAAAFEHAARSYKMHAEVGDRRGQAINLSEFGIVSLEQGNYPDAREHLIHAEEIADQISDKDLSRSIAVHRGELELADQNLALAAYYADAALMLSSELKSTASIAAALMLKARIDAAKGDRLSAVEQFERAISIFKEMNLPYQTARAYYYYGMALWEKDGNDKSNEYLLQAKNIFKKIGAMGWLRKCVATLQE